MVAYFAREPHVVCLQPDSCRSVCEPSNVCEDSQSGLHPPGDKLRTCMAWAWKRSAGAARMVMVLCATVAAKVFLLEWYFINRNCCWQEASSRSLKFLFLIRLLFRLNFGRHAFCRRDFFAVDGFHRKWHP